MTDHKLRVITLTNNLKKYPQYADDTKEFSYLVGTVQDEVDTFVVDTDTLGGFWCADEFFQCVNVREFLVNPRQLEPK